jgi:hypothetical protein
MATIEEKLIEAQDAYQQLITGQAPRVVVDQNGERVEFVAANRQALYLYIAQLQAQIAVPPVVGNRPVGFLF